MSFFSFSQTFKITGQITDSTGTTPLFGASLVLKIAGDTSNKIIGGTSTDTSGNFIISNVPAGEYRLKAMYTGYRPTGRRVTVTDADVALGQIPLRSSGLVLKGVDITQTAIRVSQNGDTTSYNGDSFKTHPDATAEDLVNKLPGVTNDNGTVKVHGEEVKQVLVDGKPFLGDDPNAALKALPADVVDQVQVYDKMSDQGQFTGFDDGQSKKTINIVTKKGSANGEFGKIYGGYGTDDRYNTGMTLNLFDNARRITVLGMSNNINQQNFTTADLFGVLGSSGGGKGMGRSGGGGYSRGGGAASNLMVGQLAGITTTNSFGLNYSDNWGKKVKVSGSYFFNISENKDSTTLSRNYFTSADSTLFYNENNFATTRNINHRFNFKFEYQIDSMNSLIITPRFTSQFTDYSKQLTGGNISVSDVQQSFTKTTNTSQNLGYTFSNGITYRHKFLKPGRTFGVDINTSYSPRTGYGQYYSRNEYFNDTTLVDQHSSLVSASYSGSSSFSWTESAGTKGQFLFNYTPSYALNAADKKTNDFNSIADDYSLIDSTLTNKYQNTYVTHRAGINYRYIGAKYSIIVGNDFQYAILSGNQSFPSESKLEKTFENVLPNATFNYKFNKGTNLKIVYRTSTVAPSVTQLQSVVDNTNPLQLKTGNPLLSQDYENTFIAHYGKTNFEKATGFFAFFYAQLTNKYIGNSTFIANNDTTVNGIFLNRGSQLTKPVNLNGYKSARAFLTYTFVLSKIKCNLSLTGLFGFTSTPSLINSKLNTANNFNLGPGVKLSSNISEKVDFTLSYNGNFNIIKNSIQVQSDNNYLSHTASLAFNWIIYKGLVVNTSLDQTFYSGLGQGYNSNYLLWSASFGYKFLKDKSLEAKISAFDLLKQNTSVTRTVAETYIEDSRNNTLQQYFMFTLTYNLKKFKTPPPAPVAK
jgi:hypothetical protein